MTILNGRRLQSLITAEGQLRISLVEATETDPGPDEVIVRVEAAPIHPSDIGLLFGAADTSTLRTETGPSGPVLVADVPAERLPAQHKRIEVPLAVGNEACGTVIAAGINVPELLGQRVAMWGGGMFCELRRMAAADCVVLPDDTAPADGAATLINPLTALGFVETMRQEGHRAVVHTAAASSLGQILVRLCAAESIPLVSIVRREEQATLLRSLGATHVLVSTATDFQDQLVDAVSETGATIAFDALGGGSMSNAILSAMEAVASRENPNFRRYGSDVHKQIYMYGGLDLSPTTLTRAYGMAWGIGAWLVFNFLRKAGPEVERRLRQRAVAELNGIFKMSYSRTINFDEMLTAEIAHQYSLRATGSKYLLTPQG